MLADTDFGSIIVAAQSGAVWGYRLLALQIILIPILYIAQELTLRLGLVTKLGHGQLIKKHFGNFWAWFSVLTLIVCCFGALISELSGIAGVGLLFNIPTWLSLLITIGFLIVLVWTRCYNSVERVAIAIGAFELIYFYVAFKAQPSGKEMWQGLTTLPLYSSNFLKVLQ
ncbi:MAG: divalent metal cation transporter, partial [Gammaproteobacteria bacterium]|nr:divalent metal cation transporter [Gammaproteobacteria bacterium]